MSYTDEDEESWTVDEVAFNVSGLACLWTASSLQEIYGQSLSYISEALGLLQDDRRAKNSSSLAAHSAEVAAVEHSMCRTEL